MEKKINGRVLAKRILGRLKKKVIRLKKKGRTPLLAIFSAGKDPATASFIREKRRAARKIGAGFKHFKFKKETSYQKFAEELNLVGKDPSFTGIIIQKPLPVSLAHASLNAIVPLEKDVDGAQPKSPFLPPVALAVLRALDYLRTQGLVIKEFPSESLIHWLTHHFILVIGRGETAGAPIAKTFSILKIKFLIAHRGTENLARFAKKADIIISCVGREILKKEMLREGAILIGVGIRQDKRGKSRGDFKEGEIKEVVSFYTPTPGGIGPLTVASLMENLVIACEK